jgi:hypothetical protein
MPFGIFGHIPTVGQHKVRVPEPLVSSNPTCSAAEENEVEWPFSLIIIYCTVSKLVAPGSPDDRRLFVPRPAGHGAVPRRYFGTARGKRAKASL